MHTEEWHADIAITEKLAKKLIETQFDFLAPIENIELLGEGWDNKVFLVNQNIVFRFPRRKISVELIERENKILPHLKDLFALYFPWPKYIGRPSPEYPYEFQGYDFISGTAAYKANLTQEERLNSLEPLSHFLKTLHSIDDQKALQFGAEAQIFDRMHKAYAIEKLNVRFQKILDRKFINLNNKIFAEEIARVSKINLNINTEALCLVHGDLDCRHLLFHQKKLSGIIDWGDTGINHKAADFAIIWRFYPKEAHQRFFEIYGEVDNAAWQYARFLGLYSTLTLLLYGHDIGDNPLVAEAIQSLRKINPELISSEALC